MAKRKSTLRARLDYWYQILNYLRPFALRKSELFMTVNYGMYRSHFKVGWRNLFRNKWNSLLNIGGLAIGMGVCLLICQYIHFESSYDRFHKDFQSLYRVVIDKTHNGINSGTGPYTTFKLGEKAKEEIPEVDQYVRFYASEYGAVISYTDTERRFNEEGHTMAFVDSVFLKVFNFPLVQGDRESALDGIHNIVISEKMAQKYFGSENPMGKTLEIEDGSSSGTCIVTGVLKELPINGHLQFEFLRPIENLWELGNGGSVNRYGGWAREWFGTYLKIKESADLKVVRAKLDNLITVNKAQWNDPEKVVEKTRLQPIADIHLKSDAYTYPDYSDDKGNIMNIQIFAIIACFILFIGWINYINLSTARSMTRAKEVGIRKSIGALKGQLVKQFIIESVLVNSISGILAIGIAFLMLPALGDVIGKELNLLLLRTMDFWIWFFTIIFVGSILSGLYPALVLSTYSPISILSTKRTSRGGDMNLRKGLIAFQFLTSIALIAGTYLVYKQITYMRAGELGMDIERILVVKGPKILLNGPEVTDGTDMVQIRAANAYARSKFLAFQEEVVGHPTITSVTGSRLVPGQVQDVSIKNLRIWGKPENEGHQVWVVNTGMDFMKTYNLELLAGKSFNTDMLDDRFVILNEEAVKAFGFPSVQGAVQQQITFGSSPMQIVGVVKNFHWQSLRSPHSPIVLRFDGGANNFISFKIGLADIGQSIDHIQKVYNAIYPENAFDYFFLNEDFNNQYRSDIQFGNLFLVFSILAVFLACIGLFALVSYSAVLRTKEIGIRKVHGASTLKIAMLLSKEYLFLLLIAILMSIPVILYWGKIWLENYAFKISFGLDHFLIPVFVMLSITVLTVGQKTYTAAKMNPVDSLKAD